MQFFIPDRVLVTYPQPMRNSMGWRIFRTVAGRCCQGGYGPAFSSVNHEEAHYVSAIAADDVRDQAQAAGEGR